MCARSNKSNFRLLLGLPRRLESRPDEIDLVASQVSNVFTVAQYDGKEASLKQSLGRTLVASIGPVCSVALRKFAVRVDIEAKLPKLGPFIDAIPVRNTRPSIS
jgi:hypothetical protein